MPSPKSTVQWVGACANDHALISCTVDQQLLSYQDPWARDPGGRTGAIKAKKIDPKYRAFNQNSTRSCAQLPNKSSLTLTRESVFRSLLFGLLGLDSSTVAHRLCTRSAHDHSHTHLSNELYSSAPAFRPNHHWRSSM